MGKGLSCTPFTLKCLLSILLFSLQTAFFLNFERYAIFELESAILVHFTKSRFLFQAYHQVRSFFTKDKLVPKTRSRDINQQHVPYPVHGGST